MQIRWEAKALEDLDALREYIQMDNPAAARKIGQRIIECIGLLREQPLLDTPVRIHNT